MNNGTDTFNHHEQKKGLRKYGIIMFRLLLLAALITSTFSAMVAAEPIPETCEDSKIEITGIGSSTELEPNNSSDNATEIDIGKSVKGNISDSNDVDYYKFTIAQPELFDITFNHEFVNDSERFWKLEVYNANDLNECLFSDTFIGNSTTAVKTTVLGLSKGTFYVVLSKWYYSDAEYEFCLNRISGDYDNWEKESNNNFSKATTVAVNEDIAGSIFDSGDIDYYKFSIEGDGSIYFTFDHDFVNSSDKFWHLRLFNADDLNNCLFSRQFMGNATTTEKTSAIGLPKGVYILILEKWYYSSAKYAYTINYTANADENEIWEKEPNDSSAEATKIEIDTEVNGSIKESGDKDYYLFSLPEEGYLNISFAHGFVNSSDTFWILELYNKDDINTCLFQRYFQGNNTEEVITSCIGLNSGQYYCVLRNNYWSDAVYNFSINFYADKNWEREYNDSYDQCTLISIATKIGGSIQNSGDKDCYQFTLQKQDSVAIEFEHGIIDSSDSYWILELYNINDLDNRIISQYFYGNDPAGLGVTDVVSLSAGKYYVVIKNDYFLDETYYFKVVSKSEDSPATPPSEEAPPAKEALPFEKKRTTESIKIDGVEDSKGRTLTLSVNYLNTVSYNGKKHINSTGKSAKSVANDIDINIDSELLAYCTVKYKFKNNKSARSEAYFTITLKPNKGVSDDIKAKIKKANAILKGKKLTFRILPCDLSIYIPAVTLNPQRTAVKKVTVSIDGKTLKLKKNEYSATINGSLVYITGSVNFTGSTIVSA